MSAIPSELKYAKTHEWVRLDGDVATIGITDHAQCELGDIVYVELPKVGRLIARGESFGAVESVKAVSDLYSPVGGEVVEANSALANATETVNTTPYDDGWMVRIRVTDASGLDELLGAAEYEVHVMESDH